MDFIQCDTPFAPIQGSYEMCHDYTRLTEHMDTYTHWTDPDSQAQCRERLERKHFLKYDMLKMK